MSISPRRHVPALAGSRPRRGARAGAGIVRLDLNERISALPDRILRAIREGLSSELFTAYPDPTPLREKLSVRLGVKPAEILLTAGADAGIRSIFDAYVSPLDRLVVPTPTYSMYEYYGALCQASIIGVPYGPSLVFPMTAFRAALRSGPRLAVVANPDQPTGAMLSLDTLIEIAETARRHDTLVLVDEVYFPFHPVTAMTLVRDFDNVVVLRSFSKVFGLAGLRIGYLVGSPAVIEAVDLVSRLHEVNSVALAVAELLLDDPDLVSDFVHEIGEGRAVLAAVAERYGFAMPPCPANFQILAPPSGVDVEMVVARLRDAGYVVRQLSPAGPLGNYFRLSLGNRELMEEFAAALSSVMNGIQSREITG